MGGLAAYFDQALGQMLLFAAERQQYQDLVKQQETPFLPFPPQFPVYPKTTRALVS